MSFLKKGDKVGIIAPSVGLQNKDINPTLLYFKNMGLIPVLADNLQKEYRYMAGTDEERGGNGKWSLLHSWPCIIGRGSNPTIRGFYTLSQVSTYHDYGGNHAEYLTSYSGDNMIHSLLFPTQSNYLSSGYMSSLGCIRITRENAAFVYYNCPGSTLHFVDSTPPTYIVTVESPSNGT